MSEAGVSLIQITVEWEVEKFFNLPRDDGYQLDTRPFPFAKGQYFLQLQPNGEKEDNNSGWTCLLLVKKCCPSVDSIAYTVGIKRPDGSIFESCDGQDLFVENEHGHGYGISLRSELLRRRNEVAPTGNITLFCSARLNPDDVEEAASQTATPDSLLSELNDYKRQVKECEEKFSAVVKEREAIQRQTEVLKDELNDYKRQVKEFEEKFSAVLKEKKAIQRQTEELKDGALQTLSENFKNLFISETQGDITVKTKDKDFTAHRSVLAARSSVFRAMLEVDMVENNDGVITIEDCDADCLEIFLLFLYAGDLTVVSASNAVGLYYLGDKYNVTELKRACSQCLSRELSTDMVCDVARLAALHGETELLETATDFFTSNMADIVSSPKWLEFFLDNTSVGNELLVKAANNLKK